MNIDKIIIVGLVAVAAVAVAFAVVRHRCFFTEVEGTILIDGKPLKGATVYQYSYSHWYGTSETNTTITDEHGVFSFPEDSQLGILALPHEPVIEQEMVVNLGYTNILIWDYGKHNYNVGGEAEAWHRRRPFPEGLDAKASEENERLKIDVNITKNKS